MRQMRACGAATLLIGLVGCGMQNKTPTAYTTEPWEYGDAQGARLETDHYVVHTTLSDERLVAEFPELMENAVAFYETLVPPKHEPARKMPVFLFQHKRDWIDFTRRSFPSARARQLLRIYAGGYAEGDVAAIQYVSHAATFPLLAHEGFHQYLYAHVTQRAPAWLNEGLAVCCEGARFVDGGARFEADFNPERRNRLAQAMSRDELLPVSFLISTHPGKLLTGPPSRVHVYYAQVWALALYLMEDPDEAYGEGFRRLLADLGDAELERRARARFITSTTDDYNFGEQVFYMYVTDDLEAFEPGYRAFVERLALNPPEPWLDKAFNLFGG